MIKEIEATLEKYCDICGADKENYMETLGEECWHGHIDAGLKVLEQMGKDMIREVDKASIIFEEVEKDFRLTLWRLGNERD